MKYLKNNYLHACLIFILIDILLFWKFFFKGLIPFPGDYLMAWYEPWKTNHSSGSVITIAHKAIADDVFRQLYVYKILIANFLKKGYLPLWNPYNGSGMPFLATMHAGMLTPLNFLFLFLPGFRAWGIYVAIQPVLISFFSFLYFRKIQLSYAASLFGAFIFTLSGFVIVRLIFGEYIYTLSGLPLLLYLIEVFLQNKSNFVFFIPFVILCMFISGQPQIILYILITICFYTVYRGKQFGKKRILFIFFLFTLGAGFAAIQLIPTLELFLQASISPQSSQFIFQRFLLPISHLITILIPNYFGNQATYNYWGSADYIETTAFIGIIPVFFAFLSFSKIPNKFIDARNFYVCIIFISILSTLDWFGAKVFFSLPIPILSTGIPSRIFVLTTFSLTILAAYGFDYWLGIKKISKQLLSKLIIFSLSIFAIWFITFLLFIKHISCGITVTIHECRLVSLRNTTLEILFFCVFLILFYVFIFRKNKFTQIFPYLTISIIIYLGLYNSSKFLPFSSKQTILPTTALLEVLQHKTGYDRVFGLGDANIKTDFAAYFHYYDPQYYDPLYNKRYGEFINFANTGILSHILPRSDVEIVSDQNISQDAAQRRDRLAELLGIRYVVLRKTVNSNPHLKNVFWQDKNWYIVKNNTALPRAYVVRKVFVEQSNQKILSILFDPNFNPQSTVLVEEKITLPVKNTEYFSGNATIKNYQENSVTVKTQTNTTSMLVLSDNDYPGWKAFIDSKETKVYRANYTFRAVKIPQGNHTVIFRYEPFSLTIGIIISLLSFLLFAALLTCFLFRPKIRSNKNH